MMAAGSASSGALHTRSEWAPLERGSGEREAAPTELRAALGIGVIGVLTLSAIFLAVGLAITSSTDSFVVHWDETVSRWLFEQRTGPGNTLSAIGTWLSETPVVIVVGSATALWLGIRRHWHELALIVGGLLVEISTYLVVVLTVDRPRPAHGLEHRATGSFPSGHVAAAIVLYATLAFLVTRRTRNATARVAVWFVAASVPLIVATSRLYREMHHLSDVVAGALIGLGCLLVAALLARHVPAASESAELS